MANHSAPLWGVGSHVEPIASNVKPSVFSHFYSSDEHWEAVGAQEMRSKVVRWGSFFQVPYP